MFPQLCNPFGLCSAVGGSNASRTVSGCGKPWYILAAAQFIYAKTNCLKRLLASHRSNFQHYLFGLFSTSLGVTSWLCRSYDISRATFGFHRKKSYLCCAKTNQ